MNIDEMKNMIAMMESVQGKSPMEILSASNPQFEQVRNAFANPMDMMTKVNGNGMDISQMMKMAQSMNKSGFGDKTRKNPPQKRYYGLSPIANIATPEIIYMLNKYLSSF